MGSEVWLVMTLNTAYCQRTTSYSILGTRTQSSKMTNMCACWFLFVCCLFACVVGKVATRLFDFSEMCRVAAIIRYLSWVHILNRAFCNSCRLCRLDLHLCAGHFWACALISLFAHLASACSHLSRSYSHLFNIPFWITDVCLIVSKKLHIYALSVVCGENYFSILFFMPDLACYWKIWVKALSSSSGTP